MFPDTASLFPRDIFGLYVGSNSKRMKLKVKKRLRSSARRSAFGYDSGISTVREVGRWGPFLATTSTTTSSFMTSFIIKAHEKRAIPSSWKDDSSCPFCRIVRGEGPAFKVYEDEMVIAVLGASHPFLFSITSHSFLYCMKIYYRCAKAIPWSSLRRTIHASPSYPQSLQLPRAWPSLKWPMHSHKVSL